MQGTWARFLDLTWQLRNCMPQLKILCAATISRCSQIIKNIFYKKKWVLKSGASHCKFHYWNILLFIYNPVTMYLGPCLTSASAYTAEWSALQVCLLSTAIRLTPFAHFSLPLSPLVTADLCCVSVSLFLFCLFYIPREWNHTVFVFPIWFPSL